LPHWASARWVLPSPLLAADGIKALPAAPPQNNIEQCDANNEEVKRVTGFGGEDL
jgi:hypothetical protein